ncbi:hypothetical protein C8J57DRAFT_1273554, partial [Mycena rebaudengoi]
MALCSVDSLVPRAHRAVLHAEDTCSLLVSSFLLNLRFYIGSIRFPDFSSGLPSLSFYAPLTFSSPSRSPSARYLSLLYSSRPPYPSTAYTSLRPCRRGSPSVCPGLAAAAAAPPRPAPPPLPPPQYPAHPPTHPTRRPPAVHPVKRRRRLIPLIPMTPRPPNTPASPRAYTSTSCAKRCRTGSTRRARCRSMI